MRASPRSLSFTSLLSYACLVCFSAPAQTAYRAILFSEPTYPPPLVRGIAFGIIYGTFQDPDHSSAAIWEMDTGASQRLHPAELYSSEAVGVGGPGITIVGDTLSPPRHQVLYNSSHKSVELQPAGEFEKPVVLGAFLDLQFGWVQSVPRPQTLEKPYGVYHAALWRGDATSFVDLHDGARLRESWVNAASVATQAGIGRIGDGSIEHAVMWKGSARSLIDLHPHSLSGMNTPPPFESTQAWGIDGDSVVGSGFYTSVSGQQTAHAVLWNGSAADYVDLHPSGFFGSHARGVNGDVQVGDAYSGKIAHAMVWRGSADSALDLHQFLPQRNPSLDHSIAFAIDEFGNIAGWAGYLENPGPAEKTMESTVVWTPKIEGSAPRLLVAPMPKTGGWVLLQLSGLERKTYRLESSLDLSTWSEFKTQSTETGLLFFKIPPQAQAAHQFFRAVEVD